MNALQVLLCFFAVVASACGKPNEGCKGPIIKINGVNYVKEVLKQNIYEADSLNYDSSSNSLYFLHNTDEDSYKSSSLVAKFNLNTNEVENIDGVKDSARLTIDSITNDVYIAGSKGIFKYNKNSNNVELLFGVLVCRTRQMHVLYAKNVLYFSGFPELKVYKVEKNGEVSKFKDLETAEVDTLLIDDNDNMFFINETGLFRQKIGSEEVVYYKDSEEVSTLQAIAINKAGDVYVCGELSGIYAVNKNTNEMVKLFDDYARGVTFDGDNNMIYSDDYKLYRLKPNSDPNCV